MAKEQSHHWAMHILRPFGGVLSPPGRVRVDDAKLDPVQPLRVFATPSPRIVPLRQAWAMPPQRAFSTPPPRAEAPQQRPVAAMPPPKKAKVAEDSPSRESFEKKVRFSEEEAAALLEGVKRYGVGKWKNILRDPEWQGVFHKKRNDVDLKDKWANMCKHDSSLPRSSTSAPRVRFSDKEEAALLEGVKRYRTCPGKWTKILREPEWQGVFHPKRTPVDLKDKWRNEIKVRQYVGAVD